jgi:hypothetical protein
MRYRLHRPTLVSLVAAPRRTRTIARSTDSPLTARTVASAGFHSQAS